MFGSLYENISLITIRKYIVITTITTIMIPTTIGRMTPCEWIRKTAIKVNKRNGHSTVRMYLNCVYL